MLNKSYRSDGNHFFYSIGLFHSWPLDLRTWFHFNSSQFQNKQQKMDTWSRNVFIRWHLIIVISFGSSKHTMCAVHIFRKKHSNFYRPKFYIEKFGVRHFAMPNSRFVWTFLPLSTIDTIHAYKKRMPLEYSWNYVGNSAHQLHLCARVWTHEWRSALEIDHFHLICFFFANLFK